MEDSTAPPSVLLAVDVRDRDQNDDGTETREVKVTYGEVYEILSWTPAKSAIKYSISLSKWLCNLHTQPGFMKKQSLNSFGKEHGFFLQCKPRLEVFDLSTHAVELHVLPTHTTKYNFGVPSESLTYLQKNGRVFSSSNGLVLAGLFRVKQVKLDLEEGRLSTSQDSVDIKICNPVTRQLARLEPPAGFRFRLNTQVSPLIECEQENSSSGAIFPNDFTIAIVSQVEAPLPTTREELINYLVPQDDLSERYHKRLLVYSNGRWEEELCEVTIPGRAVSYDMPVALFNNATNSLVVHYMCHNNNNMDFSELVFLEPYIAAFDLKRKNLSREIPLPKEAWESWTLKAWGGSRKKLFMHKWSDTAICLVMWVKSQGVVAAWVLENCGYEGEEKWRMLLDTNVKDLGINMKAERVITLGINMKAERVITVDVARGIGLLFATVLNEWRGYLNLRPRNVARVYPYVTEGERCGSLDIVGEHHLGSNVKGFAIVPYANTLRPVSLTGTQTITY